MSEQSRYRCEVIVNEERCGKFLVPKPIGRYVTEYRCPDHDLQMTIDVSVPAGNHEKVDRLLKQVFGFD